MLRYVYERRPEDLEVALKTSRVPGDTERHMITTEIMVLEICFDIPVLWMTSTFPEPIMLASQGFTVFSKLPRNSDVQPGRTPQDQSQDH